MDNCNLKATAKAGKQSAADARSEAVAREDAVGAALAAPGNPRARNHGGDTTRVVNVNLRDGVRENGCKSRFDYYQGTVLCDWVTVGDYLADKALVFDATGHGMYGYDETYVGVLPGGAKFKMLAGGNHGAPPSVFGSGEHAPSVAALLRGMPWPHRVSRADSALDYEGDGAWKTLKDYLILFAQEHEIRLGQAGDWINEDDPKGRTLYLGSRKSEKFLRCYQKGRQLGDPESTWVRVELQVRPEGSQREKASSASPDDLWGYAAWPHDLAPWLMGDNAPGLVPSGSKRSNDPLDVRLMGMAKRHCNLLGQGIGKYSADGLKDMIEFALYNGDLTPERLASKWAFMRGPSADGACDTG